MVRPSPRRVPHHFFLFKDEEKIVPKDILVRTGQEKDLETIVKFNIAMAMETEHKKLSLPIATDGVKSLFKNPQQGFYIVAEIEGQVAGSCMVTYEWSDWRNGLFWWVQSVYVRPEFRRRGIFTNLYEFLKEKASRESNVCGFRLYVEQSNHAAQKTYKSLGMSKSVYKVFEELW